MVTREFVVVRVRGDRIKLLKAFGDDKETALKYGEEFAKKNKKNDVIVCMSGAIKNRRRVIRQDMMIYQVWECGKTI